MLPAHANLLCAEGYIKFTVCKTDPTTRRAFVLEQSPSGTHGTVRWSRAPQKRICLQEILFQQQRAIPIAINIYSYKKKIINESERKTERCSQHLKTKNRERHLGYKNRDLSLLQQHFCDRRNRAENKYFTVNEMWFKAMREQLQQNAAVYKQCFLFTHALIG